MVKDVEVGGTGTGYGAKDYRDPPPAPLIDPKNLLNGHSTGPSFPNSLPPIRWQKRWRSMWRRWYSWYCLGLWRHDLYSCLLHCRYFWYVPFHFNIYNSLNLAFGLFFDNFYMNYDAGGHINPAVTFGKSGWSVQ